MKNILVYLTIIVLASNVLLILSIVVSKWFRKWKNRKLRRGLINFLGLTDWFYNLSQEEQALFKEYYSQVAKTNNWADNLTEARIYSASERPSQLLWMVAATAIINNDFHFADKLLSKAQHVCYSPWEKQQVSIAYAFLYFKQKDLLTDARENCIQHCENAIRNIEKYGSPEIIPTLPFDNLISLYEESSDYKKAQAVAVKAIRLIGNKNRQVREIYDKKLKQLEELGRT